VGHILTRGKPPSSGPIPPGGKPSYRGPTPPGGQPPLHVPFVGQPSAMSHADGVISIVKTQSTLQSIGIVNHSVSVPFPSSTSLSSTSLPTQVSEVNTVQYAPSQQSRGKKKTNNKPKKNNNNEQPKTQTPPPAIEKKPQQKSKFPYLICGDNHYTRDYPHHDEVAKLFKGNSQLAVLTQAFP
jgi:hypothetical protein